MRAMRRAKRGGAGRGAGGAAARRALLAAVVLPLALAQCRRGPDSDSRPLLALPAEAAAAGSLAAGQGGGLWLGVPGGLLALDTVGAVLVRLAVGGDAVPRLLQEDGAGHLLLRADGRLLLVDGAAGQVRAGAEIDAADAVRYAARPGYALRATGDGAIIGLDGDSLRPRWSWGRLGRPTRALALSPFDDHAYQGLAADDDAGAGELLVRDVQTGRILARWEPGGTLRALEADAAGTLYALVEDGGRAVVVALRPSARGVEVRWRTAVGPWLPEATLRVAPRAPRVAVVYTGADRAGALLDAATGARIARVDEGPIDAAFASDGALLLLMAGEVRVLRRAQ